MLIESCLQLFDASGKCRSPFLPALVLVVVLQGSLRVRAGEWDPWQSVAERVAVPEIGEAEWSENAVDVFIRAKQLEHGLPPAAEIDRRTWLRRVTVDLIGLVPTPEELAEFVADPRPDPLARERVVERLLASPLYGERWARHWLDVVRYADTDGFAIDGERPQVWRYRDYVIRQFNLDRPYEEFVQQQLAGDELEGGAEGVVATAFYRLGPYEADNMVPQIRRQDFLNEMTTTIGTAFLGMTVGCARCHDHKYDPIPQADFYRLQALLVPAKRESVEVAFSGPEDSFGWAPRRAEAQAELARRRAARDLHREALHGRLATALGKPAAEVPQEQFEKALAGEKIPLAAAATGDGADESAATFEFTAEDRSRLEQLNKAVDDYAEAKRYEPRIDTIVSPASDELPVVRVLAGGDVFAPGESVPPGGLSAASVGPESLQAKMQAVANQATGRRTALAAWIASPENPLTMRVYVNRIWQHHFGTGLVATSNDFGVNGSGCSHPELLDYLTRWVVEHGGQTKLLHRLLVLSRTYRSASVHSRAHEWMRIDPDNRLLWRAALRRLEAEALRDSLLAVSGQLNSERGGPGFFERLPAGMPADYPFFRWEPSPAAQRARRSIYMFQRRNLVHPFMESFDVAEASQSCERRSPSVTASQALSMFNGQIAADAAMQLAHRLQVEAPEQPASQLERLFLLVLARRPTELEIEECDSFLSHKQARYESPSAPPEPSPETRALRDLCLVLVNSNEFLYLD